MNEMVVIFLSVCTGIVTVSSAVTVVVNVIKKAKEPEETQNARLSLMEERLTAVEKRLDEHDEVVLNLRDSNRVTQEALWALLGHAIDGNNKDDLRKAQLKLHDRIFN